MNYLNNLTKEQAFNLVVRQANELMKSETIKSMLSECQTEQERREKLLIATLYSIAKVNN